MTGMKLLVATHRSQGDRKGDFSFCVPGELVYLAPICDCDRLFPKNGCGCSRAFAGLSSHRATTTAEVVELDFTVADYVEAVASGLDEEGWGPSAAGDLVEEMVGILTPLAVGTVVGRKFDDVIVREGPIAARR
jgi:hypothetical protein